MSLKKRFRIHHRKYPYRPPRPVHGHGEGGLRLYARFVKAYLEPHKLRLLVCLTLVCLNGCSVYLMAFYGRYVVDHILNVPVAAQEEASGVIRFDRQATSVHTNTATSINKKDLPNSGQAKRLESAGGNVGHAPGAVRMLMIMFLLHCGTIIILNISARKANKSQIIVGQQVAAQLRDDLHEKVLNLSLAYHKANTPGKLISRIMSDVEMVQNRLMNTVIQFTQSVAAILVGFIILFLSDWRMGVLVLMAAPVYGLVWRFSRPHIREFAREARHTNSCLYGLITQKLEAIKAIQAYGRVIAEKLNFHRLTAVFIRDALWQQRLNAGVGKSCQAISSLTTMLIFLLGASMVMKNEMSLGEMMFIYGAAASLFNPVLQLSQVSVIWNNLVVIMHRLVDILDMELEIDESPDAKPFPQPLNQGITLNHVSFSYAPDTPPVLNDICMHIPAGKWICIMGPSGCGKSSLLYLLSRLYECTTGSIAADGINLRDLQFHSLRSRMALVPQEAQIFHASVRDNITYGHLNATPDQIMAAAKAAEMHDLIMTLPVRYETMVGEKGADLSGGQRQRLSLARALLTDPDVLLLDDCTSALDAETEHRIQETLSRIMIGKTAIVVSQRVSMARRCDQIIVIQHGQVSESGTHDELLQREGFYARLHAQQTE